MRGALAALVVALVGSGIAGIAAVAHADAEQDALAKTTIVYARGAALFKSDARGRNETQLVALPDQKPVRALRTDPAGKVLLADLGGRWFWMPLDGTATALTPLACGDGPAQLAVDATCVVCASPKHASQSRIVKLSNGKTMELAGVPAAGARLVGTGVARKVIWADAGGMWSAAPNQLEGKTQLGKDPPLRSFLPAPDGTRALGVYPDFVRDGKQEKPVDWLMTFELDGTATRRKSMRNAIPIEWSHDGQWVLMQWGKSACIVRAVGGQYKCWSGYTAVGISPDGEFALVLGDRDRDAKSEKERDSKKRKGKQSGKQNKDKQTAKQSSKQSSKQSAKQSSKQSAKQSSKPSGGDDGSEEQASDEEPQAAPDGADAAGATSDTGALTGDVAIVPPTGKLALYRAKLDGPYSEPPTLIVSVVDGAAVVLPTP